MTHLFPANNTTLSIGKFKIITALVAVFIMLATGCSQANSNSDTHTNSITFKAIDALIEDSSVRKFNGVILISQGTETLYSKSHGYADFEAQTPLKLTDKFRIQSNTKQITAALIMKEVQRGTISLADPISNYLPELEQSWSKVVTMQQLLNMTSGITSLTTDLPFTPGTQFHYSNPGYGLLGAILEQVTAKSYTELANQLFRDMGMDNTHAYDFGDENDFVSGHMLSDEKWVPVALSDIFTAETWKPFLPTGGIISNAEDLLIWDRNLHNGQIVSDESYDKMTEYSIEASHAAFGTPPIGYGYGLRIDDKSEVVHIGHAGRGIGYASIKFYIPEDDISVIVLENIYVSSDADVIYHFEKEIRNLALKLVTH